jgi:hypothetical protein
VCVPGGGIGPLVRSGRGLENQTVAVPGHRKLQHATQVDPLNVHWRNMAQLIPLNTPRSRVMPRIQDPLDILGHPRHDDVGQQREGAGDRDEFLLAPAPCRSNAPEVDDPLEGMHRFAVVQDPEAEDLTAKG